MTLSGPRILDTPIDRRALSVLAAEQFGEMIKAAVDVGREIVAMGRTNGTRRSLRAVGISTRARSACAFGGWPAVEVGTLWGKTMAGDA